MKNSTPQHIAIVMDGNGRWAKKRLMPRFMGHRKGVDAVKAAIRFCLKREVKVLTLFAFSTENWKRPEAEVSELMSLFLKAIQKELSSLLEQGIQFRLIGERGRFSQDLQEAIARAEATTAGNSRMVLAIAANYGGQWDIVQAANQAMEVAQSEQRCIQAEDMAHFISLGDLPSVDLFIRTGGERRISNFLLWQMAYAELYFTEQLWPDMDEASFAQALDYYGGRERRFGQTSEQLKG
jgi:undecaprenyl diphosphate synthase